MNRNRNVEVPPIHRAVFIAPPLPLRVEMASRILSRCIAAISTAFGDDVGGFLYAQLQGRTLVPVPVRQERSEGAHREGGPRPGVERGPDGAVKAGRGNLEVPLRSTTAGTP